MKERERDFLEIKDLASDKGLANYIKTFCLFRIASLNYFSLSKQIEKMEKDSRGRRGKIVAAFSRIKQNLIGLEREELERVLNLLKNQQK